jgi:hypothetical protein
VASTERQHTTHEIDIAAPADIVYRIIADATSWPQYFRPTVHVERSEVDATTERLRIWATANDAVKAWTSRRHLDATGRRVRFEQEVSTPPVAFMGGEWIVDPGPGGSTRLVLTHEFAAVDDDPAGIEWITRATNRNSETELANIKTLAEGWDRLARLVFSFEGSVVVHGPLEAVYEFLYRADQWPDRLPHVARLELREDVENVQHMVMDTRAKNGSVHTTESGRVCFPSQRIVYKQLATPALLTAHTGEWLLEKGEDGGVLATSRHTITVNEAAIGTVLGPDATVESAKTFLRDVIGANSETTLRLAKEYAESRDE